MRHLIILPDLGQTTNEATIRQFLKKTGDAVKRGEPILAVSTDKVEMDVESFANGYLRQWLTEEGAVASAMSAVAVVTDTPDEPYAQPGNNGNDPQAPAEATPAAAIPQGKRGGPVAVPAARALAKERGIDLSKIKGSGPEGLITKADVSRWGEDPSKGTSQLKPGNDHRALAAMAATVSSSKREIPHFYATADVSMNQAAAWRSRWNKEHPDLHVTYNDLFVLSAARSLKDCPRLNVSYDGGKYEQHTAADVSLVVAQEPTMLLVPLADPCDLPFESLLKAIREATQFRGSASSAAPLLAISNLGMFGVKQFAAIIPPGCTSALAIGAVREQPVLRNGKLENEWVCSVTLSADHRVVDGVAAARFLERMQFHLNSL